MAGTTPWRRGRDPYRTPSPPPTRCGNDARTKPNQCQPKTKGYTYQHNSASPWNSPTGLEIENAPGECTTPPGPSLFSQFSSPSLTPSLTTTSSSVRTDHVPTPAPSRDFWNDKRRPGKDPLATEQSIYDYLAMEYELKLPDLKLSDYFAKETSYTEGSDPEIVGRTLYRHGSFSLSTALRPRKPPRRNSQRKVTLPVDVFRSGHSKSEDEQTAQQNACPVTPERQLLRPYRLHAVSLPEVERDEKSTMATEQKHLSMRSIATVVILLQRWTRRKFGHRDKSSTHREENQRVIRSPPRGGPSTLLTSKNDDIAFWLLQSSKSSDTCSVNSLESDATEDEGEDADDLLGEEEGIFKSIPAKRQIDPRDFSTLANRSLNHLPSGIKANLLNTLNASFASWAFQVVPSTYAVDGGTPPSFNLSQTGGQAQNSTSKSSNQKRPMDEDDEKSPDPDDNNPRKRQKFARYLDGRGNKRWACPYYQREPHRYCVETELGDFRKCAKSPGFVQVHRVKDHIYKCHSPKYCDRCYAIFKGEDELTIHRRSSPACEVKPPQPIEGLTADQRALLKPRDRGSKSDEERWNVIYKICFPDDEVIPAPYFVHYSREVMELRREVLEIIGGETHSPDSIDVNRLIRRVEGAFNAQRSTPTGNELVPPTPSMLTPSTSNTSRSRSSQAPSQGICRETPGVLRTTRVMASAVGSRDLLTDPSSDNLARHCETLIIDPESPLSRFSISCVSNANGSSSFEQPREGWATPVEHGFDFDQDWVGEGQFDIHDLDLLQAI